MKLYKTFFESVASSSIIKILAGILVFAYSLSFCFWGRGSDDPYYWLLYFQSTPSPLTFLFWYVGRLWCSCFGFTLLSMRLLAFCLCQGAILLPYLVINKGHLFDNKSFYSLLLTFLLLGYGTFNECSSYTVSFFLMSCLICLIWCDSRRLINTLLIGFCSALLVASKAPNLAILPIIVGYLIWKGRKSSFSHRAIHILAYLSMFAVSYYILAALVLHTFNPIVCIKDSIVHTHEESHNIWGMWDDFWFFSIQMVHYFGILALLYIVNRHFKLVANRFRRIAILVLAAMFVFYFLSSCIKTREWYNWNLHFLFSSIIVFLCLYSLGLYYRIGAFNKCALVSFSFLLLSTSFLGSDVSLLKLFPSLLVLLPLLLPAVSLKRSIYPVMLLLLTVYTLRCYSNNNISAPIATRNKGVSELVGFTDNPCLKGVLLTQENLDDVDTYCQLFGKFGQVGNTIMYGKKSPFIHCLTGSYPLYKQNFWMKKNDSNQIVPLFDYVNTRIGAERARPVIMDFAFNDSQEWYDLLSSYDYELAFTSKYATIYK